MTSGGDELFVTVGGKDVGLQTLLQRVDAEMGKSADSAVRLGQQYARLAQAQGRPALGSQVLAGTLQRAGGASERAILGVETQAARLQQSAGYAERFGESVKSSMLGIVGPAAIAGTAIAALKGIGDLGALGARIQATRGSFDALAQSANTTGDVLLASLNKAAQGTIADAQLIQSANTGLLLSQGRIAKELPRLIEIARASAKATGQEVGFVFDSLVRGIARGSPLIIDNAGITLDAAGAFETYAKSIGKSADELTKAEQQQATLNAVVAAGNDIIAKTGGAAESNATSIARMSAATENLKNNIAVLVANGLGPLAAGAAQATTSAVTASEQAGAAVRRAFSGAETFDAYQQRIQLVGNALSELGIKVQPLSEAQFNYARALVETGVASDQAHQKAIELNATLINIGQSQDILKNELGTSATAVDALSQAMVRVGSSGAEGAALVSGLTDSFVEHAITADQAAAALAGFEIAQRQAAAASAQAGFDIEQTRIATLNAASAARDAAAAAQEKATADRVAAIDSQTLKVADDALAATAQAAAQALFAAGAAGAGAAAQLAGSSSQVDVLTAAYYRLAAAQAAANQAKTNAAALSDQRAGERDAGSARTAAQITFEANQDRLARASQVRRAKEAEAAAKRGGGGGGAKLSDQQKLNNTLLADQEKADDKFETAELDHAKALLKIQKDYADKSLEQQQANEISKRASQADFYDRLTSSELNKAKGGKAALAAVDAAYQAAFAKSQELAQAGNAKQAADYLALKQKQAEQELTFQEATAKATADKDKGEVARLLAIQQLRRATGSEEEKQILAGGDANVKAREDATAAEGARYEEAQGKIADSADRAAERKILAAERAGKKIDEEQAKLTALGQAYDKLAPVRGTPTTAGATPGAAAAQAAPGAAVAEDPIAAAVSGARDAIVGALAAVERAARDTAGAVRNLKSSGGVAG